MKNLLVLFATVAALLSAMTAVAAALDTAPPVELIYKIKSSQKGIPVTGEVRMEWKTTENANGKKLYSVLSETTVALFGKVLSTTSNGSLNENGLSPDLFTEKRFRRAQMQTTFDRQNKRLLFSSGDPSINLQGGEQDRLSATWQVVALARQGGNSLAAGHEWKMIVAGIHDTDLWVFKVQERLNLRTELGDIEVLHIQRAPPQEAQGQHLDLWLAPSLDYYPVRISFVDANGDRIDQKISRINKL